MKRLKNSGWTRKMTMASCKLVRYPPLLGLFGLHVGDILGCGAMGDEAFQKFVEQMKKSFTFRTWEQDSDIEYCGAKIQRINQHH